MKKTSIDFIVLQKESQQLKQMNLDWIKSDKDALIYIGDTMCSWCHGFSPELTKLKNNHPELEFRLVMGGLRPYNTEKAIENADSLKSHWVEIEERTGQPFTHDILKNPDFVYDTEPAARAVVVARMMNPEIEYAFFIAIQYAFYQDNRDTNKVDTFLEIADKFVLDKIEFERLFNSAQAKELTAADFQLSQEMGIRGFPSMVLKKNGEFTLISRGYQTAESIEQIIEKVG